MSVKPQTLVESIKRDLRGDNSLSLILGYSPNVKEEANTTQAANSSIAGYQYAKKLNATDTELITKTARKLKLKNTVIGRYRQNSADLTGSNNSIFVYDNAMFVVLGADGWRSDEFDGSTNLDAGFSDISGNVAKTSEGIYYQCVNVLPSGFGQNSGSTYTLTTRQDLVDK